MRKIIILVSSLLVLMATVAGAAFAEAPAKKVTKSATARIVPVVAGATEQATATLRASGAGFTVTATNGSGFNPLSEYVSLAYGRNSVPVQTGNIPPCADDGTLGAPAESTLRMFVGIWLPVVGSNRTLTGTQQLNTLDNINTISIRRSNILGLAQLLAAGDIRPQVFQIRSCGLVTNRAFG